MQLPDNYLGNGPTKFITKFNSTNSKKKSTYEIKWKGVHHELPVYMISIKDLRYNLFNTRVKPHLKQYISENSHKDDYFKKIDKDKISTQRLIHDFLSKNPDRKEALKFFRDGNRPVAQEPLISTIDGRLINGNQRLCCYRELYLSDPGKYDYLQTAYVAFLPDNGTYDEERALEASFQDTKLQGNMFDWIQQGLWLIEQIKEGGKQPKEIAQTIGKTTKDITSHINRIYLAQDFLTYIEKPEYWVALRDEMNLDQAFKTLQVELSKIKIQSDRDKLRKMAFKIMEDPEMATKGKGTSVHLQIQKISKNLSTFEIKKPKISPKKSIHSDDILAPLNPSQDSISPSDDDNVIDLENIDPSTLVDVIIDVSQVAEDKKQAQNEKKYGIKQIKGAVTSLDNILKNWDNIEKKGLKSHVAKALKRLNEINDKL